MFGCRCPEKKIATTFVHDNKGYAEAEIPMYRFAEYNVVNIQCDILICKGVFAVLCCCCCFAGVIMKTVSEEDGRI